MTGGGPGPAGGDGKGAGTAGGGIDWTGLRAINPEVAGWLAVAGTPVDLPVVQPAEGSRRRWYLDHGLDGRPDPYGCPYLDVRCDSDGRHLLVFGHRIVGDDGAMFSPLRRVHEQGSLDEIGTVSWTVSDGETVEFAPLFGLKVDQGYAAIQRFGFEDEEAWRAWLGQLERDAGAVRRDAARAIGRVARCLTLVTCSDALPGQRDRTLLVCGGGEWRGRG